MTTYKIILPTRNFPEFYQEAVKEYSKRLGRYCHVDIQYLDEHQNIDPLLDGYFRFKVTTKVKSMSSENFSGLLEDLAVKGYSKVAFLINIKNVSWDDSISLTTLELSDGLHLTCLLEQIYRAQKISKNEPYHK